MLCFAQYCNGMAYVFGKNIKKAGMMDMEKNALRMPMYFGDLVAVLDGGAPDDCGISLYVESEKYRILIARFSCGVLGSENGTLIARFWDDCRSYEPACLIRLTEKELREYFHRVAHEGDIEMI